MLELKVCEGDFGLPCVDPESLQAIFYAKLWKEKVKISTHQWRHPRLINDNETIKTFEDIVKILKEPVDHNLSHTQKGYALVIANLIEHRIKPAVLYTFWLERENFDEVTSKWFQNSNFFFTSIFMNHHRKNITDFLLTLHPEKELEDIKDIALSHFREMCHYFASHLKNSTYFFGSTVSSIDVMLYGNLYPLLKIPFPQNSFGDILKDSKILVDYLETLHSLHFAEHKYQEKYLKFLYKPSEEDNQTMSIVLAGILVTVLMTGYAFGNGIIKLK